MSLGDRFLVQLKKVNWPKNNELMQVSLLCGNNMDILKSQSIPICQNICDFHPPFLTIPIPAPLVPQSA